VILSSHLIKKIVFKQYAVKPDAPHFECLNVTLTSFGLEK